MKKYEIDAIKGILWMVSMIILIYTSIFIIIFYPIVFFIILFGAIIYMLIIYLLYKIGILKVEDE